MNMHMGVNYYKLDEFEMSEKYHQKAMDMFKRVLPEDDQNWNRIYNNMGMMYRKKKEYAKARDYAHLALKYKLQHYAVDHPSVSKYYSNLFRVYRDMGNGEQAMFWNKKYVDVALKRYGATHPLYASGLSERASIYHSIGEPQKAYELFDQAQKIHMARLDPNHPYALSGYSNKAMCLQSMGDIEGAIALVRKAIRGNQNYAERYFPHLFDDGIYLASLYKQNGDYKEAQHICDSLLGVLMKLNQENMIKGATKEYGLLEIKGYHERGHIKYLAAQGSEELILHAAAEDLETAVQRMDVIQRGVFFRESETAYFDQSASLYEDAVIVNVELYLLTENEAYFDAALLYSEKSKAANLRRTINEKSARNFGDLPDGLVERIKKIEDEINAVSGAWKAKESFDDADSEEFRKFVDLQQSRDDWLSELEVNYPKYYRIKYGNETLDIDALQQDLSNNNQACVAYYLADEVGYAFYLSGQRKHLITFESPRSQLERISDVQNNAVAASANKFDTTVSKQLYRLLWLDVQGFLHSEKINRVVISPHLELNYLAFDILQKPEVANDYLIEDVALSYTNSMQIDFNESFAKQHSTTYVGFAPVFDYLDYSTDLLASRNTLAPLPSTIDEVTLGSTLFKGQSYIREAAKNAAFVHAVRDAAIVHIASHATVEPNDINKSGIHLYPDTVSSSFLRNDYLTIPEIYNLRLTSDLVILSACHTGSGDLSISEGPLSMSRAFQYAGSKSVLMSHWLANDYSTATIVKSFLKKLHNGQSKDVALQQAKIAYLNSADPLMAHPFFWASLSLYGDAQAIEIFNYNYTAWFWVGVFLLILIASVGLWRFKIHQN